MSIEQLTEFFKWMTLINLAMYLVSTLVTLLLRKLLCRWHGRLFGISEENISIITYGWLGVYKILLIVFCIVPYLALLVVNG